MNDAAAMTGVSILANVVICAIAFFLRRDLLNPLFGFSFIWTLTLLLSFIFSDEFYPLSIETELVFIVGSIGFFAGYLLIEFLVGRNIINNQLKRAKLINKNFVWFAGLLLLFGWFEYYRQIVALTSGTNLLYIFQEARYALVQASLGGEKLIGPIANLEVISIYFAMLCIVERENLKHGNFWTFCSLIIAVFYVVLGGAKGGLVTIALVVFFLFSFNSPWRVVLKRGLLAFLIILSLFSLGLIMVNYTYNEFEGVDDIVSALLISIRNYWIGGLFAFGQVVDNPDYFLKFQSISRFFLETANSFGADFYVPPVHAEYINISDSENTNVFTIFYSYYLDGGLLGVFLLFFVYSFVIGYVYLMAMSGDKRYILMYALLLTGIVFSIVSERFFLGLNGNIKAFIFWWGVYFLFSGGNTSRKMLNRMKFS